MQDEHLKFLCEQVAVEQDPLRLIELVGEINDLLEAKREQNPQQKPTDETGSFGLLR